MTNPAGLGLPRLHAVPQRALLGWARLLHRCGCSSGTPSVGASAISSVNTVTGWTNRVSISTLLLIWWFQTHHVICVWGCSCLRTGHGLMWEGWGEEMEDEPVHGPKLLLMLFRQILGWWGHTHHSPACQQPAAFLVFLPLCGSFGKQLSNHDLQLVLRLEKWPVGKLLL